MDSRPGEKPLKYKKKTELSSASSLRRLRWIVLVLGVLLVTLIETYHFLTPASTADHVIAWLAGLFSAVALIWLSFREVGKLQSQIDQQLEESQLQLQRQAVLIQLSLKLTPTLDEEKISAVVINELRHAMGYQRVEMNLVSKNTPKDRLPPATPFFNPARLEFPLEMGGEILGTLLVASEEGKGLTTLDHSFLNAVANHAAVAIVNSRLLEFQRKQRVNAEVRETELRSQQRSLKLLNNITQSALRSPDLAATLQTLTLELVELFEADGALLALWDEDSRRLTPVTAYGPELQSLEDLELEYADLSMAEASITTEQPVVVKDTARSMFVSRRLSERLSAQSLLALPLTTAELKLGVAMITFKQPRTFSKQEVSLGEQAASQVALAIAKERALQAAQDRAQELDALQRATAALLSTLDLENLLGQILDASISAIPAAQQGSVYLVARDTGQLQVRAVQTQADPRIRAFTQAASNSYTARAVRERIPLLIHNAHNGDEDHAAAKTLPSEIASTIIAPLVIGDQILGAISLESLQRNAFNETDLALLVSFAATATTAIQNAELHAEVQKQAVTDTLTGLYNRRGFLELGRREVERAMRFGHPLTALMFDIDLFKQINDLYGHLTGDRVLMGVTSRCAQELRQIDLLGRYGGDEFIVLLPETSLENARFVAERLRLKVAQMNLRANNRPLQLSISIGVAALDGDCKTLEDLVEKADHALYQAKEAGRNRVMGE